MSIQMVTILSKSIYNGHFIKGVHEQFIKIYWHDRFRRVEIPRDTGKNDITPSPYVT